MVGVGAGAARSPAHNAQGSTLRFFTFEKVDSDMQKTILIIVAAGALIATLYYVTRPEPTPADRLSDAIEDVGQAARDSAEQLANAANEAAEALQSQVESKSDELQSQAEEVTVALATRLSDTTQDAQDRLTALMQIWRETGIVTDSGIDFDAAIAAVEETDMSTDERAQVISILEFVRDAPGAAQRKMTALETALQQ
jgi:hypothetical protein